MRRSRLESGTDPYTMSNLAAPGSLRLGPVQAGYGSQRSPHLGVPEFRERAAEYARSCAA